MHMKWFLLLLVFPAAFATVHLVTPVNTLITSDLNIVEISPVGPGHEIFLKFLRATDSGYYWDEASIVNRIDADWLSSTHSDYEYIYYSIVVPANKPSGEYTFEFEVRDREGLMESEIAVAKVFVTHDPADLIEVVPFDKEFEGFAAQENNASFRVRNKAMSRATYMTTTSLTNLPSLGADMREHHFEALEEREVVVPFSAPQEGGYELHALVWSEDNPTISLDTNTVVWVKPTIQSKLRSIGQGFPFVPITMAPFYALLGVLGF
ncbi:MAG: hypothetical protein JW834_01560 [Candidatus Diapherotrites archaeon]|nr:hypothetical protein [Candidatus Diapherotrites archaeon]